MITQQAFTKDWFKYKVTELKKTNKNVDPALLDKVIKAMYLLECLIQSGMPFVFKGGTALILLFESAKRFSIDIDIVVEKGLNVEEYLNYAIKDNNVFKYFIENKRQHETLPVAHYKLYYDFSIDGRENYIIIDVLFEKISYIEIIDSVVQCDLIDTIDPILKVKTPSIDCILGDKLTAFAPNKVGMPYGVGKELEIIKQLFDIGSLFEVCTNLDTIRQTFIEIVKNQIKYRGIENATYMDVLDDIFETSLIIAHRGKLHNDKFKQLEFDIGSMRSYVLGNKSFIIEEAIKYAAKAAYLAMLLKSPEGKIERYVSTLDLKDYRVNNRMINTIKKFSPEGFYYWYKGLALKESMESMLQVTPALET